MPRVKFDDIGVLRKKYPSPNDAIADVAPTTGTTSAALALRSAVNIDTSAVKNVYADKNESAITSSVGLLTFEKEGNEIPTNGSGMRLMKYTPIQAPEMRHV
jgi:hypothetical protein